MNVRMLALLIAICGLAGGSTKRLARALPNQDQNQGQQPTVQPMDKTPVSRSTRAVDCRHRGDSTKFDFGGGVMLPNAVKLAVTASVPLECEFWTEDDDWKGACVELSVTVHGSNFEQAKKNMEAALQAAVECVLRDRKMAA